MKRTKNRKYTTNSNIHPKKTKPKLQNIKFSVTHISFLRI
jgi:hypothetical protein